MGVSELDKRLHDEWYRDPYAYVDLRNSRLGTILWDYGEALRRTGDPRGDLIALDFGARDAPGRAETRAELLGRWLGPELAACPGIQTSSGLLSIVIDGDASILDALLVSPGALYIQTVDIAGAPPVLEAALQKLAKTENNWLGVLGLRSTEPAATELRSEVVDVLIERCPFLRLLDVNGVHVLREFVHPTMPIVEACGHTSLTALSAPGPAHRSVTCMRLELFSNIDRTVSLPPELPLIPRESFPNLTALELDIGQPAAAVHPDVVFHALNQVDVLHGVIDLTVPAPRSHTQRVLLQQATDRMPSLDRLRHERSR